MFSLWTKASSADTFQSMELHSVLLQSEEVKVTGRQLMSQVSSE